MSQTVKTSIELKPFITLESNGDPDPSKRSASLTFKFYGADALDKAHQLHDAIVADVKAAQRKDTG